MLRAKNAWVGGLTVAALTGLAGCELVGLPLGGGLDNLALMAEAEQIVQATYPRATLIELHGNPSGGTATTAADIDQLRFIFDEDSDAPAGATIILEYADGAFGDPVKVEQGWVGTMYERLPRDMSLDQAVLLMRLAGHAEPFTAVTLRKPLTFPVPDEASYMFTQAGQFVLVGVESGEVTTE